MGGAQSFGVTESARVSPKVCAPRVIKSNQFNQKESSPSQQRENRGQNHSAAGGIRSRKMCPDGVLFATRSASGGWGAVLVANLTRAVIDGVSVRGLGTGLGLQPSKPDDKHGNANGRFSSVIICSLALNQLRMNTILEQNVSVPKLALNRIEAAQALALSPATIDRLTARGLLRPSRATYRPIYAVTELQRFLDATSKADCEAYQAK